MILRELLREPSSHHRPMLLWIFDGLGGLPHPQHEHKTELEAARLPNLDALASRSACGLLQMASPGVAVGSGAGHLALFGYDPLSSGPLRGALEVVGSEHGWRDGASVEPLLPPSSLAIRGNFAHLTRHDGACVIADRRASQVDAAQCDALCELLSRAVRVEGVSLIWLPGRAHRFSLVLTSERVMLDERVADADPQRSGVPPLRPQALAHEAEPTAAILTSIISQIEATLADDPRADTALLRGLSRAPTLAPLCERFGIHAAALATYPMYRGVARMAGMSLLHDAEDGAERRVARLEQAFEAGYDLIYFHVKETDELGHRGDFLGKVAALERWDALFERVCQLDWSVIAVTGDHSTPSVLAEHSWHPPPLLLWSPHALCGDSSRLTERACARGVLHTRAATDLLPLMIAESGRLRVFGG
jgi:2,3-bisphosphoglycerate-independent phosphoglycerate mutase